jgi:hypothetical protein
MRIDASGNVGIGTTTPGRKLDVNGTILLSGSFPNVEGSTNLSLTAIADNTGTLGFNTVTGNFLLTRMTIANNGNITGTYGNYHVASDIRLKKDVVTIPDALEKVLLLRGVNYRWKDGSDNESLQMGMIAQEVEKVIPQVVHTTDDEMKTKAIEYQYLVGLLVEATKEQQTQAEQLKAENEKLSEELLAMKARQEAIEAIVFGGSVNEDEKLTMMKNTTQSIK